MRSICYLVVVLVGISHVATGRSIQNNHGDFTSLHKRSVEFMGMRVSYPQYLRLVAIQREVIKMDQTIRAMVRQYDPVELAENPYWMELLELYDSLKKMLPPEYLATVGNTNPIPI